MLNLAHPLVTMKDVCASNNGIYKGFSIYIYIFINKLAFRRES